MFHIFHNQNSEKQALQLVFFAGLVFLFGELIGIFYLGYISFFASAQKLTIQSNLFSLIVVSLYLKYPKAQIFKTNLLFIFVGGLLLSAAFGFWFLLFPIYFINLETYLVSETVNEGLSKNLIIFYLWWNHLVVQLLYLNMLKKLFENSTKWKLYPAKFSSCMKLFWGFWIMAIFVISTYSALDIIHPAYGILTNLNWNTKFKTADGISKFNLNIAVFAIIFVCFMSYLCTSYIWWMSIKKNPITKAQRKISKFNN